MASAPAAAPALGDDPLAKAAAWIWLTMPRRIVVRFPSLRDVLGDGHFLTTIPAVAVFLPVAFFGWGLWAGATGPYELVVTESVFLLSTLLALGAFSTQLGLLALVGFALGDFFVRFTGWSYTVLDLDPHAPSTPDVIGEGQGLLDDGLIAGLWRVRLPMLLVYLLLGAGVVVVPRLARGLAALVLRTAAVPPNLDWLVGSFSYVVAGWLALEGWAASLPLLLRPYFMWKGGVITQVVPASATIPIQHFRREILAAAVVAAICRQLVVLAVERNRPARARLDVVVALAGPIRPPRPAGRRRVVGRVLATAVIGPLMVAGMLERTWTWALAGAVFLAVGLLRSELVPRRLHDLWARVLERLPLLVRVLGIVVLVRVVAGFMAGSVITSYESLAVFVLVTTFVSVLLLPPARQAADGADGEAVA